MGGSLWRTAEHICRGPSRWSPTGANYATIGSVNISGTSWRVLSMASQYLDETEPKGPGAVVSVHVKRGRASAEARRELGRSPWFEKVARVLRAGSYRTEPLDTGVSYFRRLAGESPRLVTREMDRVSRLVSTKAAATAAVEGSGKKSRAEDGPFWQLAGAVQRRAHLWRLSSATFARRAVVSEHRARVEHVSASITLAPGGRGKIDALFLVTGWSDDSPTRRPRKPGWLERAAPRLLDAGYRVAGRVGDPGQTLERRHRRATFDDVASELSRLDEFISAAQER